MRKIILAIFSIGFLAGLITGCKKEKNKWAPNAKTFNLEQFRENLKNGIQFSAGTVPQGYSFLITRDGVIADSFSFGTAFMSSAGGPSGAWTTTQEINIASVSKTMTAVGVLQLLEERGLTLSSKIGPWLPNYFNAAQSVKDITFEELLTHSSGLLESNTSYDSIKATVARGLDNQLKPKNSYANINFALFRIIIPYLRDKQDALSKENSMVPGNTAAFESWLSTNYLDYMQQNVFTPIGMNSIDCTPSANTAQAFSEPSGPGQISRTPGDWTQTCGGGGYFMSVRSMARVMAYLTHTEILLSKDQRSLMDQKLLGWDPGDSPMTTAGRAYGKDGALFWDTNSNGSGPDQGEPGLQTLVMKFPNKVELAIAVNSIPGSWRSLSNIATNAYNNAWE